MTSVGTAFPREVLRVRNLVDTYHALPDRAAGALAAGKMLSALDRAVQAWESGDVVAIACAYSDLRAWA